MAPSTVSVTLIDDAASSTMATVDLPIANLPETFELETTLHLGDNEWTVVSAEPRTKLEFASSGKLILRLRKIEMVDLSDLLYSLPSICDRLPEVADTAPGPDDLILAEDDSRQFELVSRAFAGDADAEIAAIRAIHEQERAGIGWKEIHVRKRPDPPIASMLRREEAPGRMTAVFVDLHGHVEDVNLLDDLDRFGIGQVQMAAAAGAGVEEVVGGDRGEHLGREELALVRGMSRLAAALASRLAGRRLRLGRLDDVGGRRLGRVGGVLQGRGELLLQLLDDGLEGDELGAQVVDFDLEPLAIGTRRSGVGIHGRRIYTTCDDDSTL